jgi:hypothetical protein
VRIKLDENLGPPRFSDPFVPPVTTSPLFRNKVSMG